MKNYLVTGGAGFIGSHIVQALLEGGNAVRVLDNFSTGRRENLLGMDGTPFGSAPWPDRQGRQGRLEVLEGDLRDPARVRAAVRDVEVIFHEAAFISVPESMKDPQTCFEVNVQGTARLLEAARRVGVRKVVLASSTAVYGDCDSLPIAEEAALSPLSPYAVSKQVNELYAGLYTRVFGLPVVALRYFNVYGPRQAPDSPYAAAIPIFLRQLLAGQPLTIFGDGKQTRDFIFIKDVVHANLLAAEADEAAGQALNICTGRETSLLDLLEYISEIAPQGLQVNFTFPRPGDTHRSLGDPARAATTLGFRAQTRLADGLRQTMEWMQQ